MGLGGGNSAPGHERGQALQAPRDDGHLRELSTCCSGWSQHPRSLACTLQWLPRVLGRSWRCSMPACWPETWCSARDVSKAVLVTARLLVAVIARIASTWPSVSPGSLVGIVTAVSCSITHADFL
ncbi:hypothetical protein HaLaN_09784 [Haematococcus lacustris]|uniref:Uncharacterized protein n=1 Tax=Haematococcus lacustris TaxID=44745 RepID=A0A699ZE73_HAELA|nr:hypothetical protein HaLaN_09784 [Haematococcus lacustris]